MTLAPRVVVVRRSTELEELLAHHGTRRQVEFFLSTRGSSLDAVAARHEAQAAALATVSRAIPLDWRRGEVERKDLSRFLFAPDDLVVVVGQDGLVANVAKYLDGQRVIGLNPDPAQNPGVLVPHAPERVGELLHTTTCEVRTMVEASTDDGQSLVALNEVFVGPPSHQTARYRLLTPDAASEHQASSGVIVATGTGSTGWARSLWLEHHSELALPGPTESRLAWFVREAWPSPATGTALTEGCLTAAPLRVRVESERLVVFGDGIEDDRLELTYGQEVAIGCSRRTLHLVR